MHFILKYTLLCGTRLYYIIFSRLFCSVCVIENIDNLCFITTHKPQNIFVDFRNYYKQSVHNNLSLSRGRRNSPFFRLMSQISLANLYMMYLSIRTNNQELFFDLMNFSPIAPLKTQILKKINFLHF